MLFLYHFRLTINAYSEGCFLFPALFSAHWPLLASVPPPTHCQQHALPAKYQIATTFSSLPTNRLAAAALITFLFFCKLRVRRPPDCIASDSLCRESHLLSVSAVAFLPLFRMPDFSLFFCSRDCACCVAGRAKPGFAGQLVCCAGREYVSEHV